jgi:alkylmercury lyase
MVIHTRDFERISKTLLASVPLLSSDEQRVGRALYDALAVGEPVRRERLAESAGVPTRRVVELLEGEGLRWLTYYDEHRSVIGFGGLAVVPMHHRLVVGDRTLYAWCAWDTLFIPELLRAQASVASDCPEAGETIQLTVAADGIKSTSHPDARVSFLPLDARAFRGDVEQTMTNFCHFVFFLVSSEAGESWTSKHEGTCLLTLDQAFELGKRKNAAQFPDVLHTGSR